MVWQWPACPSNWDAAVRILPYTVHFSPVNHLWNDKPGKQWWQGAPTARKTALETDTPDCCPSANPCFQLHVKCTCSVCWTLSTMHCWGRLPKLYGPDAWSQNIHLWLVLLQSCTTCELAVHYSYVCSKTALATWSMSWCWNCQSHTAAHGGQRCTTNFRWQTDTQNRSYTDSVALKADRCSAGDLAAVRPSVQNFIMTAGQWMAML